MLIRIDTETSHTYSHTVSIYSAHNSTVLARDKHQMHYTKPHFGLAFQNLAKHGWKQYLHSEQYTAWPSSCDAWAQKHWVLEVPFQIQFHFHIQQIHITEIGQRVLYARAGARSHQSTSQTCVTTESSCDCHQPYEQKRITKIPTLKHQTGFEKKRCRKRKGKKRGKIIDR